MTDDKRHPATRFNEPRETVRRLFAELVHQPRGGRETKLTSTWQPSCDMVETDEAIIVEIEVPGMQREDVRVEVQSNTLHIAGDRRLTTERQGRNFHYLERHYGHFERQLPLPSSVDRNAIRADFDNGVLTVTLPKLKQQEGETSQEGNPYGQR